MDTLEIDHDLSQSLRRDSPLTGSKVRRTACDRCRAQKLRCDRTLAINEFDQCDRCSRTNAECITTPALPTGRPRLHQDSINVEVPRPKRRKRTKPQAERTLSEDHMSQSLPTSLCDMIPGSFDFAFLLNDAFTTPTDRQDGTLLSDTIPTATGVLEMPFSGMGSTEDTLSILETENLINMPVPTQTPPLDYHVANNPINAQAYSSISSELAINDRQKTLYRLSQLNSALFRHLTDCDIAGSANKYSFLSPGTATAVTPDGARSTSAHLSENDRSTDKLAIGQMLGFLQEFLGILRYFLVSMPVRSAPRLSPRSSGSDTGSQSDSGSNSDSDSDADEYPSSTRQQHQLELSQRTNATDRIISAKPQDEFKATAAKSSAVAVDYPTMLALINCYVSLIRLYRNALEKLLSSLQTPSVSPQDTSENSTPGTSVESRHSSLQTSSSYSVPAVLPGLHIDGFTLTNHRTLQIAVFMQVSMDLLQRVERSVAGLAALDSAPASALGDNMALLTMMLQREAATSGSAQKSRGSKPGDIGLSSLRLLVKRIRRSVRDNVCLQLEEADFRPALGGFGDMVL